MPGGRPKLSRHLFKIAKADNPDYGGPGNSARPAGAATNGGRGMLLSRFFAWCRGRAGGRLGQLHIRLYTRRGCHLCDAAWLHLRNEQRRYGFVLSETDVDGDPELAAQFGECVPVVTVNGKVRFRGGVQPVLLRRLLRAEGQRRSAI
jgi:hypothetical protein